MMIRGGLHLKPWPYGFKNVMFLTNILPSQNLENKSPFELLYQTKSDYSCLRIFGCLYYPYTRLYLNSKLDVRSTPYVFLGYSEHKKGFNFYDPIARISMYMIILFSIWINFLI